MRKKIVAGNWKMNKTLNEAIELAVGIEQALQETNVLKNGQEVIVCPTFPMLASVKSALLAVNGEETKLKIGAQNCHQAEKGAFTGEVSAAMLQSIGMDYVLIGHSERRAYFKEDNVLLKQKTDSALANGLKVIFCCGEQLAVREAGNHFELVKQQLSEGLFHLNEAAIKEIVLAYEPVWAIGTGVTASPEQAEEMHAFIRQLFTEKYGEDFAQNHLTILYGGSCKPANAEALFANPNVDGGLIGGAALKVDSFLGIIKHM